jgi:hypothetical protein
MMRKVTIAVLLLIAVSYTAGASACVPGSACCGSPARIGLTSADLTAEACCAPVAAVQASVVSARTARLDLRFSPDHAPELAVIPPSDATQTRAQTSRRAHPRADIAARTGSERRNRH